MSKQHTPGTLVYDDTWALIMAGNCEIAAVHARPPEVTTATARANAARLVQCWNEYDQLNADKAELIKALRIMLRWTGALPPSKSRDLSDYTETEAVEIARAAIAKA